MGTESEQGDVSDWSKDFLRAESVDLLFMLNLLRAESVDLLCISMLNSCLNQFLPNGIGQGVSNYRSSLGGGGGNLYLVRSLVLKSDIEIVLELGCWIRV